MPLIIACLGASSLASISPMGIEDSQPSFFLWEFSISTFVVAVVRNAFICLHFNEVMISFISHCTCLHESNSLWVLSFSLRVKSLRVLNPSSTLFKRMPKIYTTHLTVSTLAILSTPSVTLMGSSPCSLLLASVIKGRARIPSYR